MFKNTLPSLLISSWLISKMLQTSNINYSEELEPDLNLFWNKIYTQLSKHVRAQIFKTFFSELSPLKLNGSQFVISSKDPRVANHLNHRYASILKQCASEVFGKPIDILIQNNTEPVLISSKKRSNISTSSLSSSSYSKINLDPNYTFHNFVEGPSNQNAFLACKGAANKPSDYHNPIFISGSIGLGKTHLLMAVGNYVLNLYPWLKVKYVSAEDFQSGLIDSYKEKSIRKFRAEHRDVDVFLFDDIQLITSRAEHTQEELFNTFNYLYQHKKQILISSDRPAQRLSSLKDRLISRFQSGLIVDIKPPNFNTRIKIIKKKSEEMNLTLDEDVIEYLAHHITTEVRLIEAALIRLDFFSQNKKIKISIQTLKEGLENIPLNHSQNEIKIQNILTALSSFFQLKQEEIVGRSQTSHITLARHIGMYLTRSLFPDISLSYIASIFGRSDHTTVMYAEKKIRRMIERDLSLKNQIDKIQSLI